MASILTRARALFQSPADRRLAAAAAEVWSGAPQPRHVPAGTGVPLVGGDPWVALPTRAAVGPWANQGPARTPPIDWFVDQPPPPPPRSTVVPGYTDHMYQQFAAPYAFEGWDLGRINAAVAAHRLGYFVESSSLLVAILGFAPVLAALQQAVAPILALRRTITGGDKGIARFIAGELADMLTPRSGLKPSIYMPPELWGTMSIYLRMHGFCVLQHADGDMDPVTGVRPRFTRIWEPWATTFYRTPRKRIAVTTEGNVEIKNDGHFTLVCDEQEPHFTGALVALGEEAFGGKLTQNARNAWLDFFGDPKLVATLPEKVQTTGDAGDAFESAVEKIYGPGGRGVLPYGSKIDAVNITGEGSTAFREALIDRIIHIFMVLTGSAGTIGAGGPSGAGPYQPQKGGPWNVRHDLIARPIVAMVRGINQGHIGPYCDHNYADAIDGARRAGTWVDPVLEIPIVAPDRDERIESEIKRHKALVDQVVAEKAAGAEVTSDRIKALAAKFEVEPFDLAAAPAGAASFGYDQENGIVTIDQRLAELGKPATGDDRGKMTVPEYRAWLQAKVDRERAKAEAEAEADASANGSAEDTPKDNGQAPA